MPSIPASPNLPVSRIPGFSLIELLAVMAVMAVLMGVLAPAVANLGQANKLERNGFQVVELAQLAQQNAMARNALTALVIATDPALKDNGRLLTLYELQAASAGTTAPGDWKQTMRWNNLGDGIVLTDCVDGSPTLPVPLPAMQYAGTPVTGYKVLVFLPDGSLLNSQASLRLVGGYYPPNATTPVLTGRKNGDGGAADYCAITVLPATGKVKLDRP